MSDCRWCNESPAVVDERWCELCWAELETSRQRVEHLQAFHDRAEALSKTTKIARVSTLPQLWETSIKTRLRRLLTWH